MQKEIFACQSIGANECQMVCKHTCDKSLTYINGLVQDFGNSSALAMELPQSCTKLFIYATITCVKLWYLWYQGVITPIASYVFW